MIHSPEISVIEGAYLRDLLAQPQALADTVDSLRGQRALECRAAGFAKIVLTGMGSSLHALHPLQLRLVRHGHTALMIETGELAHTQVNLLDQRTLLVVASQSGRSVETLQLLEQLAVRGQKPHLLAVTNTPDSPLAAAANTVVLMRAGQEFSVSCKTYLATLVALEWLGAALCGSPRERTQPQAAERPGAPLSRGEDLQAAIRDLERAAPVVQDYLAGWRQHVQELAGQLKGTRDLFITGRGSSLAAAATGGLIVKEAAHLHAEGMSSPAFRHGPFEMVSDKVFVLVFAGDPATAGWNETLVRDVRAAGGRAAIVGKAAEPGPFRLPEAPGRLRPILEILPVQMISLALSALAGREAGRFERASKVTVTA